ncbi:MAG: protease complex subunit PrcB family protein [Agathobacter sp.]|nr:protease complex subunit PrcB family protein [Agathobacter sp.]
MNKRFKQIMAGMLALTMCLAAGGCAFTTTKTDKIKDLSFTVQKEADIPEILLQEIEQKKGECFKLTYTDGGYTYIANGYGKQPTNGYSIQVKNLYLTENAVCFKTELYGPQDGEDVSQAESFPYIVVKLEAIDLPVVFE